MMEKLDKIFGPVTLLILNIVIIFAVEFAGKGTYFFATGLIHAIAIFFIFLAAFRIFMHYYSYDHFLEKFVHGAIVAFVLLAASHVVEFVSYTVFHMTDSAVFANVANFYAASLLAITLGAERFLATHDDRKSRLIGALKAGIIFLVLLSASFFINNNLVSLETTNPVPFIYAALSILIAVLAIKKVSRIKKITSYSAGFANYLIAAIILILISVFPDIFYDQLRDFTISNMQIIYLSHFIFYAALSLIFLAFKQFSHPGGVYEEAKKIDERKMFI